MGGGSYWEAILGCACHTGSRVEPYWEWERVILGGCGSYWERGGAILGDAASPFQYDWHRLRVTGLALAAVLCVIGIIVLLSGKCKCRSKASRRRPPPEASHLVGPGAATTC
ncbi:FXYD domain-containing ion transport regulator 3-like [Falco biarmicus]|uniref:FXYD domain-containing ion transport regulator 3-like n=1 Tax=Falco biarmicus TaxID=345155 RepID=UPI0024BC7956|nr:FXYD domain-containing ion transport regulator 3-like [Falco biarmicus]